MAAERFDPTSERAAVAVRVRRVSGDLTGQRDVDALVNTWNRNYMPRWFAVPKRGQQGTEATYRDRTMGSSSPAPDCFSPAGAWSPMRAS